MKNAKELLDRYLSGEATSEEKALVESWYLQQDLPPSDLSPQQLQEEHNRGLKALQAEIIPVRRLWPRWAAAAAVLLCIGTAIFYMAPGKRQQTQPEVVAEHPTEADLPAGTNKAVLTLSSGKKISLTDATPGSLAREYGLSAEKTADGELVYTDGDAASPEYHTISTPAGGQYQVTLPDGSHVWLNAASSLRYPVKFVEQSRLVELSGEAYFEVNKQARPFIVQTGGQQVKVLGTHFNINGYANEAAIKTTLLEGSVRVGNNSGSSVLLKPGQMAVNNQAGGIRVAAADVDDVMAWKNGLFIFNNEHIRDIMTKLARWYDIEVEYEGDMSGVAFQGNYQRSRSLVNLLRTIEQTNSVRFKIEGRRVTVIRQ
jgi:transmembrane sensor